MSPIFFFWGWDWDRPWILQIFGRQTWILREKREVEWIKLPIHGIQSLWDFATLRLHPSPPPMETPQTPSIHDTQIWGPQKTGGKTWHTKNDDIYQGILSKKPTFFWMRLFHVGSVGSINPPGVPNWQWRWTVKGHGSGRIQGVLRVGVANQRWVWKKWAYDINPYTRWGPYQL